MALLALLFASCGTASYVEVISSPAGARIFVEGWDTGHLTPARIDLEDHAPDPDQPMRIEVRRAGFVPSVSVPYPARHRCGPLPCPKKQKTYLPCRLAMFETGGGVRIDTHYDDAFEVSFDDGEWLPVTDRSAWTEDSAGRTFDLPPGPHTLRYRPLLPERRRSVGSDTWTITVPEQGYLAIVLRWSPSQRLEPPPPQ
jgi:hypothetical protein